MNQNLLSSLMATISNQIHAIVTWVSSADWLRSGVVMSVVWSVQGVSGMCLENVPAETVGESTDDVDDICV